MKTILKNQENKIITGIMLLTIIVAISPLISRYCINGHDLDYHLLRIEALKENILIGKPFLKVSPLFYGGAGYASGMFYSDFLLYIPALLRAAGVSINASYHIFVGLCVVLCLVSTYYCVFKMTGSKYAGLLASIMLTLCPYHMDDLMVRAAAGEYTAFIFVPFVIYGIYNLLYEEMSKPWIIGVGFGGVILCHTATTVMCLIFAVVACIVKFKVFIKNKKVIIKLFSTAGVTALITAVYWLPMLEQFASDRFGISSGGGIDMLDAAVDFSWVLSQQFPTIGIYLLLPVVFRFFISKEDNSILEYVDWLLAGGAIFCILATNIMPWEYLGRILSFVQFPWRFFLIASVLFAIADAIIIKCFIGKIANDADKDNKEKNLLRENIWHIVIGIVFIAMSAASLIHQSENAQGYYDYSDDYYSYKPHTCNVIGGEWLPEAVTDREIDTILNQSEIMISDSGREIDFNRNRGNVISEISEKYDYVDVPVIYYKGYSAYLKDKNGQKIALVADNKGENGFCRVYTNGLTGMLTVSYVGTKVLYLSYILSLMGIVAVIIYITKNKGILRK